MHNKELKWYYYIIALVSPFTNAANYVLSKYVIDEVSPITLLFFRWLCALLILTPFAIKLFIREFNNIRANWRILFIMAISGIVLFNFFTYLALRYTTSTNVSIIISIFPILVLVLGAIIDKQKLVPSQIYSILFSFTGVIIIVTKGDILQGVTNLFSNSGDFITLAASASLAIYVFAAKFKPPNLSYYSFLYSIILISTMLILPVYLLDIFYFQIVSEINILNVGVIFCIAIGALIGLMALNLTVVKIGAHMT